MAQFVIVSRRFGDGGASTNRLIGYAKGFADAGHSVRVVFLIRDAKGTKLNLSHKNIVIEHLWEHDGVIAKKFKLFSYIKNLLALKKSIKKDDILFTYNAQWPNAIILNSCRKMAKIYYETNEHPNIYGNRLIEKLRLYYAKKANGVFVISEALRNYYLTNGINNSKILTVNMFVDHSRFEDLNKHSTKKYIAYCGTVSKHKDGVDDLIAAFKRFSISHPDYLLYIIGDSESVEEFNSLKDFVKDLQLSEKVVFVGKIPAQNMPQLLFDASILALARPNNIQSQNGFPTKLGEYLATGNPVAVTDVGEISLFIKDRINGFVSPPDNIEAFANTLEFIADNYDVAQQVGAKGKLLIYNEFSYLTQTQKIIKFIFNGEN